MAKKKNKKDKKGKKEKKDKKLKQGLAAQSAPKKEKKEKKKSAKDADKSKSISSIGALIKAARTDQKLTQDELAVRCGTNKSYISRIENNATDMRVSTLMKLIEGLNGELVIEF